MTDPSSSDLPGRLSDVLAQRVADTMFALSTPSRLQILACLRGGPRSVSELVTAVGMEQSAVSHQLRVLRDHGVVKVQKQGRARLYSLGDEHIARLLDDAIAHADPGTETHAGLRPVRAAG